jgi:hypothetical protein
MKTREKIARLWLFPNSKLSQYTDSKKELIRNKIQKSHDYLGIKSKKTYI